MSPLDRDAAFDLLDDALVVFVGDSTARRACKQLMHFLKGDKFRDYPEHNTVSFAVTRKHTSMEVGVMSHWLPRAQQLTNVLEGAGTAGLYPSELFPLQHLHSRKVFVLHYSTHDFVGLWGAATNGARLEHGFDSALQTVATAVSNNVGLLKRAVGVDVARDIILVRGPLAEACVSKEYLNFCNTTHDPVNRQLMRFHAMLVTEVGRAHPDVPVLDLLSWTWAPNKVDRAPCATADDGGTHFSTDAARSAYVQQVLYAVRLLSADKHAWEPFHRRVGCSGALAG